MYGRRKVKLYVDNPRPVVAWFHKWNHEDGTATLELTSGEMARFTEDQFCFYKDNTLDNMDIRTKEEKSEFKIRPYLYTKLQTSKDQD